MEGSKYLWKKFCHNDRQPKKEGNHGCNFLRDLLQEIIIIHSMNILDGLLCATQYSKSKRTCY